jgi:hypothetical protein
MTSDRPTTRRRGASLLEVTLAMGLLVALSSMTFWFYSSVLGTREHGTEEARQLRLARVVLDQIATEIRQASLLTANGRVGLRGGPERIWLSSLRVPTRELMRRRTDVDELPTDAQYDLVKTEYKIARHPDVLDEEGYERALGLARIEIRVPRKDSAETGEAFEEDEDVFGDDGGASRVEDEKLLDEEEMLLDEELRQAGEEGSDPGLGPDINWEELYAPEIRHLRFCYFDGYSWWNSWDVTGDNPLPQLVQVTIGFEGHPPFGEAQSEREDEEFCECLNEEPVECEPFAADQFTTVVRLSQADPFFRSRISRETQAFLEELGVGSEEEGAEESEGSVE